MTTTNRCDHQWKAGRSGSRCAKCKRTALECFTTERATLTLEFSDPEMANHFKGWMCDGGGEQQFWDSCDHHMNGIAARFDWHQGDVVPAPSEEREEG